MNHRLDVSGDIPTLILQGDCTLANIAALKATLIDTLAACQAHETLGLDLGGVRRLDAAFLQLLCSAHRTAGAEGKGLSLLGERSEQVLQVAEAAGFTRRARCPHAVAGPCFWQEGEAR